MEQPETRHSLILRLQSDRNERAWEEFVAAYEPFLRRLIQRRGVADRHVPDVMQQLLMSIARSVEGWKDDGDPASFRRWLSRVARNVALKFMNCQRRQIGGQGGTDVQEMMEQVADEANQQAQAQAQDYEYELIVWAAEQVRTEFRETSWKAFWATLIDGRDVADVATELGVTPGSIYMSRSRIMARIRARVSEIDDE